MTSPKKCFPSLAGTSVMNISQKGIDFLEKMEGKSSMLKKFCSTIVTTDCRMDNNSYGFYNDHAGYCTIGVGHLVGKKSCADIDRLPPGSPIKQSKEKVAWVKSKADADNLKKQDLVRYVNLVNSNVKVKLTQEQFDALVSLAFNIESAVDASTSTLMKHINSGNCDPASIASDFRAYNKITDPNTKKKIESPALTERRIKEANIFNYGIY
jgi:lysozyme